MISVVERHTVLFAFFERADFGVVRRVIEQLQVHPAVAPQFLSGFDFKEHTGEIPPLVVPHGIVARAIGEFYPARTSADDSVAAFRTAVKARTGLAARLVDSVLARKYIPELVAECNQVAAGLRAYVRTYRPSLVVLPEDTDYIRGRLAATVLAAERIPCAVLTPNYYAMFNDYPLMGEGLARWYLVPHSGFAARLARRGVPAERVRVVGFPTFDDLVPAEPVDLEPVLFALQGFPGDEALAKQMLEIGRRLGRTIYLKPHPDTPAPWIAGLPADGSWRAIPASDPVRAWLPRMGAVVGVSSTVLYEALLLGRQAVVLHLSALRPALHMPPEAGECVATSWKEVEQLLRSRAAPANPELLRRRLFPHHPRSTQVAADTLVAVLGLSAGESGPHGVEDSLDR